MAVTTETKDKFDVLIGDDCHITPSQLHHIWDWKAGNCGHHQKTWLQKS
jgi:hypothetical protein